MKGSNNQVKIGQSCHLNGENWIYMSGDNNHLLIGNNVTFDEDVHFILSEGTTITVGNDCMFAKHINVRTSDQHGIYDANCNRINYAKDVSIGEHVWIGASVLIMKGVTIGNGSVVGIQSMVTKDIPNNCVAAGQPARVLKERIHWTRSL
jgi:acetyltransferase-like isoleucine patch superfamily enzyme